MSPQETGQIGAVGSYTISFSGGKAQIAAQAQLPGGLAVTLSVSDDASALVDALFAAIEKHSPAGAVPIEEGVKSIVKSAVAAIQ